MKILFYVSSFNGLSQYIYKSLYAKGHHLSVEQSPDEMTMLNAFKKFKPQLVVCPFLKHKIPEVIWNKLPCLILHPGIVGDKGPSSIDWALLEKKKVWGATLLEANDVFDAGKVWGTRYFDVDKSDTKSSVYRNQVKDAALDLIIEAVDDFNKGFVNEISIKDYPVIGCQKPLMIQADRKIDWRSDNADEIIRKVNAADSFPGVVDRIDGTEYFLFGATKAIVSHQVSPGSVIGQRDEAICRATIDGAIWIKQLKKRSEIRPNPHFKLPAVRALDTAVVSSVPKLESALFKEISIERSGTVAYLSFDFYNGAFSTEQCENLKAAFDGLKGDQNIKVIALMGGESFFSNGIHLNCIEAAEDPALESWRNINAMNDLVKSIIESDSQLVVAGLQTNAGAGGAILPLACDYIIARQSIVLNPHYKTMGLTGSEYWTYLLPKRVGQARAQSITNTCMPILADEAEEINFVDAVFCKDKNEYQKEFKYYCQSLAQSSDFEELLKSKQQIRREDENKMPLETYRRIELESMKVIFDDPESDYHRLRGNFVRKIACGKTPKRLVNQSKKLSIKRVEKRRVN